MPARVRYLKGPEVIRIEGVGDVSRIDREVFFGPSDTLESASLSDLRRELARYWESEGWVFGPAEDRVRGFVDRIDWSREPKEAFDEDDSIAESAAVILTHEGQIALEVTFFDARNYGSVDFVGLLAPLLSRRHATLRSIERYESDRTDDFVLRIHPAIHGRTFGDLVALTEDVQSLVESAASGVVTHETALDLLRGGHADLLIGLPESSWLEAKSAAYNLAATSGKIELAQDVARFANSETAGILLIGARTQMADGERIVGLRPLRTRPSIQQYRGVIDARVYPPIDGLSVEVVPVGKGVNGYLLVVHIPLQPEAHKPFLVHGAMVGHHVEGAFISIVRRRGEGSIPVDAAAIHADLVAGRTLRLTPRNR